MTENTSASATPFDAALPQASTSTSTSAPPVSTSASTSPPPAVDDDPIDDLAREAPRALVPGALLQGQYEIKEVLARGVTNLYLADSGGYGPSILWILAEREVIAEPSPAPVAPAVATPASVAPVAEPEAIPVTDAAPASPTAAEAAAPIEAAVPIAAPNSPPLAAVEDEALLFPTSAPPEVPVPTPADASPSVSELEMSEGVGLTDAGEFAHGTESGALPAEAGVFDAPAQVLAPLEMSSAPPESQTAASPAEAQAAVEAAPIEVAAPTATPTGRTDLFLDEDPDLEPVQLQPAHKVQLTSLDEREAPVEEDEESIPPLLSLGEVWEQDGRQYCAWEWQETTSLQDFRDATNDERFFEVLERVAYAIAWQKGNGRVLGLNRDTLRFDARGHARFYGFSSPLEDPGELLRQLRGVADFLLKHTFANSGTMRLDDPFAGLPIAEETKAFAHALDSGEFETFEDAHAALQVLAPSREMEMSVALITDTGRERELNEDSALIARCSRKTLLSPLEWELLVVADGMGGHEGGEVASDLTVRTLHEQLLQASWDWSDNTAVKLGLLQTITATNAAVAALSELPKHKGARSRPGSTLTFAVRIGRRVFVGNVGDSRAYIFRDGQLGRVTKDHSYVQNLIDAGALAEEDAWDHPDGSVITAHIGEANLKTRDIFIRVLRPGDKLLLVSDGVIDMLRDRDIAPFLQEEHPGAICRKLVDAANAAGGADNITALCLCCY